MRKPVLSILSLLAIPSVGAAQAGPSPYDGGASGSVTISAQAPPTTIAPVQVPSVVCPPVAETMYTEGMNRMSTGDDAGANTFFGRTLELCPNHPSARDMQRVAQSHMSASPNVPGTPPLGISSGGSPSPTIVNIPANPLDWNRASLPTENALYGPENTFGGTRGMFVIGTTMHSMVLGGVLPGSFVSTSTLSGAVPGAGVLLGGALGVTTSLLLSLDGVTSGQAHAMFLIPLVGEIAGLGMVQIAGRLGASGTSFDQMGFGLLSLGTAAGIGAGALVAWMKPTGGRVNVVASSAIWGAVVTTALGQLVTRTSTEVNGGLLLGGLALGGGIGALIATNARMSAGRMWWINLSLYLGAGLVGGAIQLLASSASSGGGVGSPSTVGQGIGLIIGLGLGGLAGVLLTRNYDRYWEEIHPAQERLRTRPPVTARRGPTLPSFTLMPSFNPNAPAGSVPLTLSAFGTF